MRLAAYALTKGEGDLIVRERKDARANPTLVYRFLVCGIAA